MQIFDVKNHVPVKSWMSMESPDEWETLEQVKKITLLPWVFHHVALMSDGHIGRGATIGSVIAMKDAISPNCVGSDIGCGMAAIKLNLKAEDLPDNLLELRTLLEERIPVGFNSHNSVKKLTDNLGSDLWTRFNNLNSKVLKLKDRARHQCGTLGGGETQRLPHIRVI